MVSSAQRLTGAGVPMVEFPQSVPNLTEASSNLYELIKSRNLMAYEDAEIKLAISRCVAIETSRGWRISKEKQSRRDRRHHRLGASRPRSGPGWPGAPRVRLPGHARTDGLFSKGGSLDRLHGNGQAIADEEDREEGARPPGSGVRGTAARRGEIVASSPLCSDCGAEGRGCELSELSELSEKRGAIASAKTHAAVIVNLTRDHSRIAASKEQFDRDPELLNTPGGVVNLRTGEMRAQPAAKTTSRRLLPLHLLLCPRRCSMTFLLATQGLYLPPEARPCAACAESVNEPDKAKRIELHKAEVEKLAEYQIRLYGYAATGCTHEHVLILQLGPGGNGKGALNDLMEKILGMSSNGFATELPVEALLDNRRELSSHRPLRGARSDHQGLSLIPGF